MKFTVDSAFFIAFLFLIFLLIGCQDDDDDNDASSDDDDDDDDDNADDDNADDDNADDDDADDDDADADDDDDDDDDDNDDNDDDDTTPDCTWSIETVETPGVDIFSTTLALDSADRPAIIYNLWPAKELKYAFRSDKSWDVEIVDSDYAGRYSALAFDSADVAHIAYWSMPTGSWSLFYSNNQGGVWQGQQLFLWYEGVDPPSLAVDQDDAVHIAFGICSSSLETFVLYFTNRSGAWLPGWMNARPETCPGVSLAIDPDGKPGIAFARNPYLFPGNPLWVSRKTGVIGWRIETAVEDGSMSRFSLVFDPAGAPAAVHSGSGASSNLYLADKRSGVWQAAQIHSAGEVMSERALAADTNGRLHVAFFEPVQFDLMYGNDVSGNWAFDAIDETGDVGQYASIAIDSAGNPHISYVDQTNGALKYAACLK